MTDQTPSAPVPSGPDAALGAGAAALGAHWAVATIDADERAALAASAAALWEHPADAPDATTLVRIHDLATAYDLAALEALPVELTGPDATWRTALVAGASAAFELYRALPIDQATQAERCYRAMHVAALGVVAERALDAQRWLDRVRPALALDVDDDAPWPALCLGRIAGIWVDLLRPESPERIVDVYDRLGALRELQTMRERAGELDPASEGWVAAVPLHELAEAAVELVLHMRRGPHIDGAARVDATLRLAHAAVLGDVALGTVIQWLRAAAVTVAARQTSQLAFTGLDRA